MTWSYELYPTDMTLTPQSYYEQNMSLTHNFLCFYFLSLVVSNEGLHIGTMAPKGDFSRKNTKKKATPKSKLKFTNEETSDSSEDLVQFPMKKVTPRDKHPRGNKVATPENTLPRGRRMKNPSTTPLYSPLSFENDEDEKNNELESDAGVSLAHRKKV